jgi:hypothetical protein
MILSSKLVLCAVVIVALGAFSMGCGHLGALKEAAAADLNCSQSRVHVHGSGKTRDVEACGQQATYLYEDGDWRMVARGGAPAGGPPPVMRSSPNDRPPGLAPGQPMGTPSQPPPSSPPPGGKSL